MNSHSPLKVLSIQTYAGGSHQQFAQGWRKHSDHEWTTLELPARHWKWRMRHACIHFSEEIARRYADGQRWNVLLCTDMLAVAEFKGLLPAPIQQLPIVVYFHENQIAYPNQADSERDLHFAFTNFTSALAADRIWFNSEFNFQSMLSGLKQQSASWPDFVPHAAIDSLARKSSIQPPGIEPPAGWLDECIKRRLSHHRSGRPIHLIWAARWEHDKGPDELLAGLIELRARGTPFRISVIGQSFRNVPASILEIQNQFSDEIVYWGFQKSRSEYWNVLADADIFISTARHEFFGIAAAEAIACGLVPILPNRLAYPELIARSNIHGADQAYLYDGTATSFANQVQLHEKQRATGDWTGTTPLAIPILNQLHWKQRSKQMDLALLEV